MRTNFIKLNAAVITTKSIKLKGKDQKDIKYLRLIQPRLIPLVKSQL